MHQELNGFCFDIEADNLYLESKQMWLIRLKALDGSRSLSLYPFRDSSAKEKFLGWVESFPDDSHVVGFNHIGYDIWMIWKFFGIKTSVGKKSKDWIGDKPVQFVDGFVLSQYLNPNSPLHSLAYLSGGSEDEKIDYRQSLIDAGALEKTAEKGAEFRFYHELLDPYCEGDVDATISVVRRLWKQGTEMYGDKWLHPSFRQMQKDYWLYTAQAYSGIKFNQEKANALVENIEKQMDEIKKEVDPKLPPRELKTAEQAFYRQPAKPFTKSGEKSATFVKWLEKHSAMLMGDSIFVYDMEVRLCPGAILPVKLPMEIDDNAELKQYFLDSGWKPSEDHWNFKKGPDGKPERDSKGKVIKTTPKINHAGVLCPNLEKLDGDIPRKVVKYLSLRNRLGVVKGWLSSSRLQFDGRLSSEISGYAPTSRVKHRGVVNVPKADIKVLLGNEMRDLFTVDKNFWYIGTDAAALENRTLASYTFKYDGGAFAKLQTDGDPHCYSEDTQILTPSGWKTFGELGQNDFVAQWESGSISFVQPSHIVWQDYEGDMVSVKNNVLDFLVTPEHRVLVRDYRTGKSSVKLAKDLKNNNSNERVPLSGETSSSGISLLDDEIRFIVAVQADSYKAETALRFEFVKDRKISRMRGLLNNLGIPFTESTATAALSGSPTTKFYIRREDCEFVDKYITEHKEFSDSLLSMSSHQCTVFTDEVALWDGTITKDGDTVLDTTCRVSCDLVATIAALCGRKATRSTYTNKEGNLGTCTIQRCYISKPSKSLGAGLLSAKITTQYYKGKIGCVSVPSTFVLVKRNNCIFVSGNTFNAFAFFPHLTKEFDPNDQSNKDNPLFKPWRNKAKTGAYLLAFGGGAPKLASSLGLSKADGQRAFDNYWLQNKGLGLLKKAVEAYFDGPGGGKYIPAIDGRLVSVRGKNVLLSCLGQGLGAICMSYAACLMDTWLGEMHIDKKGRPYYLLDGKIVKRIGMFHDEYSWEVEDGAEEAVRTMSVDAIIKAGEFLKLSLPLNGEGKKSFEGSWKDVH